MMPYRYIDLNTFPRADHFAYFQVMSNPYVSVSEELDVTVFRRNQKNWGDPLFLTLNYCLSRAANQIPEFRQRILDSGIIEYDHCISSHTVLLPDETYTYCETDASLPLDEYLLQGKKRQADVIASHKPPVDEDPLCLFFISSVPWRSLTGLIMPLPIPADSNPRFTWTRMYEKDGRIRLPFFITAHHGLVDGIHLCRLIDHFEDEMKQYSLNRFGTR